MQIDIQQLCDGPLKVDNNLIIPVPKEYGAEDKAVAISASYTVSKTGHGVQVAGTLSGALHFLCSTCLAPLLVPVEAAFTEVIVDAQNQVQPSEEDFAYSGDIIDLSQVIYTHFYLSIPMKVVCKNECKGLCPICGINLNHENCECKQLNVHPAFSALKNMFDEEV